jgi:hypothetical protein
MDDLYDDHPKVMAATHQCPLAAALHPQAITASSRRESDGLVDPFWLRARAPEKRKRDEALAVLVELRLFDVLPAGHEFELFDAAGFSVIVGKFTEDRHLVHDYLDYNPSSAQLQARRLKEAERKARGRNKESAESPGGVRADISRTPDGPHGGAGAAPESQSHPSPIPRENPSAASGDDEDSRSAIARRIFTHWQTACNHPTAKFTSDRRTKVEARLREGFTEADLIAAVDGAARAPFTNGDGKTFDDLELICRTGSKVEDFMRRTTAGRPAVAAVDFSKYDRATRPPEAA